MPKNAMTLSEFVKAFDKLKAKNWVKSKRKGATGIGHTLEKLIGLPENNVASPDLGEIELKAHRINSSSMITLFTFNRKVWKMKPLEAIKKYGTPDEDGRLGLYFTMSRTPNSTGLFLHMESETISVRHISGEIVAEWQIQTLAERFVEKIPALILVSAFSEMRGDDEWFKFDRAQLLTGTSAEIINGQILSDNVFFHIRLSRQSSEKEASFAVKEDSLTLLFKEWRDL